MHFRRKYLFNYLINRSENSMFLQDFISKFTKIRVFFNRMRREMTECDERIV